MQKISKESRIKGGLYGVACGDALGATLEFTTIDQRKPKLRNIVGGGWLNLQPGEWTDDTEMTLAVARGILEDPEDPIEAIGRHFMTWRATNPPDIGGTISRVLSICSQNGGHWHAAAQYLHHLNGQTAGNGALMRTLPVGLFYRDSAEIFERAISIARMTHWDIRAGLTCAFYCLFVAFMLKDVGSKKAAQAMAMQTMSSIIQDEDKDYWASRISALLFDINPNKICPNGYTVDSLICALWAFAQHDSLEECIVVAVNLGGDADTIGAIAGGLAGVYYGYEAIPERWIQTFPWQKRAELDELADLIRRSSR